MADIPEAPAPDKNARLRSTLIGALKHIGIPSGVAVVLVTFGLNWLEAKNQEFSDTQAAVQILRSELNVLKAKAETDSAQWRAIQRFHDKLERVVVTARANEIVLDKVLDDVLHAPDKEPEEKSLGAKLDRLLGRKKDPEIVVRRVPPQIQQSVEEYQENMENQFRQEQEQIQAPMGK